MTTRNASGSSTASLRGTQIYEIAIAANKPLKSIEIFINHEHKDVTLGMNNPCDSEQKSWNTKFNPPLDLSLSHQILLELHRKLAPWGRAQHIEIGSAELVSQDTGGEERKGLMPTLFFFDAEWKKSYDAADVTIHFISQVRSSIFAKEIPNFQPTTERINLICPR
ncbi:hypothetical protein BYT27DRAFT_7191712 [Phlegmacium glaucopus]|nr:hypothetical protein BYT27DRAFT_7191712 [Phlegmacium glaucopus]